MIATMCDVAVLLPDERPWENKDLRKYMCICCSNELNKFPTFCHASTLSQNAGILCLLTSACMSFPSETGSYYFVKMPKIRVVQKAADSCFALTLMCLPYLFLPLSL